MGKVNLPVNEKDRQKALERYQILDTESEEHFDNIVKLASQICQVPTSMISLIDKQRQWIKAKINLEVTEAPREHSFCTHAIHHNDLLIVEDATKDARFRENPFVACIPGLRFYAGAPLITHDQYRLGTLCVVDQVPHTLNEAQKFALKTLAAQVIKLMEARLQQATLSRSLQIISDQKKRILSLLEERSKIAQELNRKQQADYELNHSLENSLCAALSTIHSLKDQLSAKKHASMALPQNTRGLEQSVESLKDQTELLLKELISHTNIVNK